MFLFIKIKKNGLTNSQPKWYNDYRKRGKEHEQMGNVR